MNIFSEKLKDVLSSVLPIVLVVIIFSFFSININNTELINFGIGTIFLICGLTLFLVGVDIGITPFGNLTGPSIAKKNNLKLLIIFGLILGFTISIAEPSLIVLSNEISSMSSGSISSLLLIIITSLGLSVGMVMGLVRIIYNHPIHIVLLIMYLTIFALSFFTDNIILQIAFDTSGSTTGVIAVPFVLALGRGITLLKKDSKASEEDSFGLVSIASAGAIISVMILGIFMNGNLNDLSVVSKTTNLDKLDIFFNSLINSIISFLPIIIIFFVMNKFYFKLNIRKFRKIIFGFIYSFIGLVLLLHGIDSGFMHMAYTIGLEIGTFNNSIILSFAFLLGLLTILAEPALHVLVSQIQEVTSGYIKKKVVLLSISIGVGFAVLLSALRILIPDIELWYLLLPLYLIAIIFNYITPKLFVGIAFDAGGVATGPMTATFILAFINGITKSVGGISYSFGMISLVAVIPILVIQILGIIFKFQSQKEVRTHAKQSI